MDSKQKFTEGSNPEKLARIIQKEFSVDLFEKARTKENVEARCIFAYIMKTQHRYGYSRIGRIIGKNHATIIHYIKNFEDWYRLDQAFKQKYMDIVKVYSTDAYFDEENNYNKWYENILLQEKIKELEKKLGSGLHRLIELVPDNKREEIYERFSLIIRMNCK